MVAGCRLPGWLLLWPTWQGLSPHSLWMPLLTMQLLPPLVVWWLTLLPLLVVLAWQALLRQVRV